MLHYVASGVVSLQDKGMLLVHLFSMTCRLDPMLCRQPVDQGQESPE